MWFYFTFRLILRAKQGVDVWRAGAKIHLAHLALPCSARCNTQTESFLTLPVEWQEHLKALYNDYYYVRQDDLWRAKATEKLPALLGATDMLVCGEDLGMVPACVPGVMAELNIMSLGA